MRKWFIVSAVGRDRPGIVADLAQLVYDCDANLEDSRMTILGNEFAAILLCSGRGEAIEQRLSAGARRLEWQNRLTVLIRPLEGEPRPALPAPGTKLFRISAQGEDRAGIVARVCRALADRRINIADLRSEAVPTPSGAALYRLTVSAEVPEPLDLAELRRALDALETELGLDIDLDPV